MSEYPAMIRLTGKKVTVIGGGKVAERKIDSLLQAGGSVVVVSPDVTEPIKQWAKDMQLTWISKDFEPRDVNDAFLVIAATNQRDVNEKVFQAVNEYQLINIVDHPEKSNFIVPSTFRQGHLTIAISTSGASPGLAKKIKRDLANQYDASYGNYLDFLKSCREVVKQQVKNPEDRKRIFEQLLTDDFLKLTQLGEFEEREKLFMKLLQVKE
ncbi:precorrin-2 dehydrogenase / sirohydrochlorin ferrochelatase [Mesobacillus persicus]|uniref:precorrin-2 dehydrogenase n=1 Tax=Mesobacillus persicus TaxID=930146 RepID=A0A1H8F1K5_9BACI|nr:NAD(P)-binding protein [Mesobacillus persicus]SEN25622.1 precorrin-2 dehydrogenase / sirohydrochlorin ferrochelatase [Mesobacillus persicus]